LIVDLRHFQPIGTDFCLFKFTLGFLGSEERLVTLLLVPYPYLAVKQAPNLSTSK